VVVRLKTFYK